MNKIAILLLCLIVGATGCAVPAAKIGAPSSSSTSLYGQESETALEEDVEDMEDVQGVHDVEEVEDVDPQEVLTNGGLEEVDLPQGPSSYQCAPVAGPIEKDTQQTLDEALGSCQMAQDYWEKGELEKAIEALDQAFAMLLSIDTETGGPGALQAKEDLRYLISKRMLEIYTARFTVATGNHNAIPLDMNEYVEEEIRSFTGPERKFFIAAYQRSGQYRPRIVEALRAEGLPEELSWLPLIESGFKVKALSSARALGMWQFIASTGYRFGLARDRYIDERMDPEKATQGAIGYLKELHSMFGDWTTCLAAYNCGEGRVLRLIQKQNVNYLDNFWDLYQALPKETARYVPRFLAALHIINNPAKYGMDLGELRPPIEYEKVPIVKQVHLNNLAEVINVSKETLKELNPELRYQITPNKPYELKVPPGTSTLLLANIDRVSQYELPKDAYVLHRIRQGETLTAIARKYGASSSQIKKANHIKGNRIAAGNTLKIPIGLGYRAPVEEAKSEPRKAAKPSTHVVRRGDSLWNIAQRYGTTINNLKAINDLSGTNLVVGQKLKISGTPLKKKKEAPPKPKTYVVKKGDTPGAIAKKHGMSLKQLMALNGLKKKSTIFPGQKIKVQ